MIKVEIPSQFLVNRLLKSLRSKICKDATMMGSCTEEEEILRSQQLYFIYSQLGMIYNILPNAPKEETDPMKATPDPHVDRVINSKVDQVTS